MNSALQDLNLSIYQQISFQDDKEDALKSADIQRKCLVQMLKGSCLSLSNSDSCDLLESKLKIYSNTVENNGQNIYDKELKKLLTKSNKKITQNIKSNLDKINVNSLIKPLSCSLKNHCTTSETFSDTEFGSFMEVFSDRKHLTKTSSQFKNSNPQSRQQNKIEIVYPESNGSAVTDYKAQKSSANPSKNISASSFKTARDELQIQNMKKYGGGQAQQSCVLSGNAGQKRKLGTRRNINSKFISPLLSNSDSNEEIKSDEWPSNIDDRLKNIEPKMIELIKSEIMDCGPKIHWNDIAGLSFAKTAIQEAVVWPMLRPDIFTGLRRPPKGILLFGPPGTGKTLIGKCVASQSKSTFFSISASSLTSKWIGDGEKMVRALFVVARVHQPSVIFIDEIDSLLSQRTDTEHESSRRIKTEFLVQLDGATTDSEERILVIGATNRPQELDEAARRRFVRRLHIPLPEYEARLQLIQKLISNERHELLEEDFKRIASLCDGYSGADIRNLCSEASLGPIRSLDMNLIEHIQAAEVRPLLMEDFENALTRVRSSVSPKDLEQYMSWDKIYGSGCGF